MRRIITILKTFLPKELPKPVGRWRTEHCDKQRNLKIDLSNDHCGPCSQYVVKPKK
jgi:hypothetical protein